MTAQLRSSLSGPVPLSGPRPVPKSPLPLPSRRPAPSGSLSEASLPVPSSLSSLLGPSSLVQAASTDRARDDFVHWEIVNTPGVAIDTSTASKRKNRPNVEAPSPNVRGILPPASSLPGSSLLSSLPGSSLLSSRPGPSSLSSLPGPSLLSSLPGPSSLSSLLGPSSLSSLPGPSSLSSLPGPSSLSSLLGPSSLSSQPGPSSLGASFGDLQEIYGW